MNTLPDFRMLFQAFPVPAMVLAPDSPRFTILAANDAYLQVTGKRRDEILGRPVFEVFPDDPGEPPGSEADSRSSLERALRHRLPDAPALQRHGIRRPESEGGGFETRLWSPLNVPVLDESGDVRCIIHRVEDVTERKQAEEARRTVFNSTYDATLLHEADGTIRDANQTFLRLYGVGSVEQARTLSIAEISSPSSNAEQLPGILNRVRTVGPQFFEWKARRVDDGQEFDAEMFLRPIRLYGKEMILANIRDVSEQKRTQRELRELNLTLEQRIRDRTQELEASNKELEAFSYSVSHDLRAPLRGIDGFSRILLERYADRLDAAGQDYLNRIRNAALRMNRLIDDMLRLSRIGRTEIRKTTVNLTEMAGAVVRDLRQREPERKMEVEIAPDLAANADAGLLRIVLENLIGNAFKFTSKRGVAKIEIGMKVQKGERVFYVRDNGAGFDMAYADKLFAPFHRLHRDAEFAGSGIGLASVQRIIARHGGRIWTEAAEDQGATFFFTLGE